MSSKQKVGGSSPSAATNIIDMNWRNEKERLEDLILVQNLSYIEIGKMYNVTDGYIRKVARKLGINLPQRRKINSNETFNKGSGNVKECLNCGREFHVWECMDAKFYSMQCSIEYKRKEKYKDYLKHPEKYYGRMSMRWVKPHILKEQNHQCAICGIKDEWKDKPLVFILDHIDGHANNNARPNLRLICPNCDSQLDTYKSKNKTSDRKYYHYNHR